MAEATDPVKALMGFLKADAALSVLVGQRIFGGRLPVAENDSMPRKAIVIQPSGGGGAFGGGYQEFGDERFDFICYGETAHEADRVWRTVRNALKQLRREMIAGCLLHWARESGGGRPLVDPETDWPFTPGSFQVLAAEVTAV